MTVLEYVNDENPIVEDTIIDLVFEPIKQQLKRDLRKWEGIREKRSKAGKISANKRQQKKQVLTSVDKSQQDSTNPTVSVNDTVNVNDNVIVNEEDKNIYVLDKDSTIEEFQKAFTQRYLSYKGMQLNEAQIENILDWFHDGKENNNRFSNFTVYKEFMESMKIWSRYSGSKQFNFPYLIAILKNRLGKLWAEHQENKSRLEKKLEMEEIKAGDNGSFGDVFVDMNFKLSDKKRELSEKEYGLTDDKLSARKKNIIKKEVTALKLEIEKLSK